MAARLPGFRRERGTGRGYIGANGERISYRQYRNRLEQAGAVKRLDVASLANSRRRQRAFNDIVNQMAKVRSRALDQQIETARARRSPDLERLERERRHLKSEIIKSDVRKAALDTLKHHAHKKTEGDRLATKEALIALGRREGIPDWVPVGGSDRFRAGLMRPPARVNRTGRSL